MVACKSSLLLLFFFNFRDVNIRVSLYNVIFDPRTSVSHKNDVSF